MDATMSAQQQQQPSLSELLHQSRTLTNQLARSELPPIQLGLDQIETQSRKLLAHSHHHHHPASDDARAHYFLAKGGIDAARLADTLSTTRIAHAFEPLRPIYDADVESYLQHQHQQVILAAIEDGRRDTLTDFYRNVDRTLHRNWQAQKRRIMHDFGAFHPSSSSSLSAGDRQQAGATSGSNGAAAASSSSHSAGGALQMHSKMMRYDLVVRKLNDARRDEVPLPVAHLYLDAALANDSHGGGGGASAAAAAAGSSAECWRTLTHLVGERDVHAASFTRSAIRSRQYAGAYSDLDEYHTGSSGVQLRKRLVAASRAYLEQQFAAHMDETIARNPVQAQLGGVPSVQSTVAAYCRVHLQAKHGQWLPELETVQTAKGAVPIWAHLYFLLRIGQEQDALTAAAQHEPLLRKLDHSFLGNLKSWLDSPDRVLPKMLRDRFYAEYNARFRSGAGSSSAAADATAGGVDPYKLALYKLIGRIEPRKRFPTALVRNSENWLWLQLSLCREHAQPPAGSSTAAASATATDDSGITGRDSYTLHDVATTVLNFGEAHFDPKANRPMHYFQILTLVGQLERAVAFLHSRPACQADAVQFAIALSYYGLLRVPAEAHASQMDYLVLEETRYGPIARVDFAKMIARYVRPFVESDAREALQHIYLVCLHADAPSPIGQEQVAVCHELVRGVVLDSRQYFELLGDVRRDGTKQPGLIERDARLIMLPDTQAYLSSIVRAAAQASQAQHRTKDAILLYNLAQEYDTVVTILNKELGATLLDPTSGSIGAPAAAGGAPAASFAATEDLTSMAFEILASYERQNHIVRRISIKNRETCKVLLELKRAVAAYSAGDLEAALQMIESLELIPLKGDVVWITRKAEEFKEIDAAISSNLSDVLLMTMSILAKLHAQLRASLFGDAGKQRAMVELRTKARSLLTYAGQLRLRMSNETYSQLLSSAPQ